MGNERVAHCERKTEEISLYGAVNYFISEPPVKFSVTKIGEKMNCQISMKPYPQLSHFGKCYEAFTKKLQKPASGDQASEENPTVSMESSRKANDNKRG